MAGIYSKHVLEGMANFDVTPQCLAEMDRRRDELLARRLPRLVAVDAAPIGSGQVFGDLDASTFRPRPTYRYCLEDSINICGGDQHRGAGRMLLAELLAQSAATGVRQMLGVIGDSLPASIALQTIVGFARCGLLSVFRWKFEGWRDVTPIQRPIRRGLRRAAA